MIIIYSDINWPLLRQLARIIILVVWVLGLVGREQQLIVCVVEQTRIESVKSCYRCL